MRQVASFDILHTTAYIQGRSAKHPLPLLLTSSKGLLPTDRTLARIHQVTKELPPCWRLKEGDAQFLGDPVQRSSSGHGTSHTLTAGSHAGW